MEYITTPNFFPPGSGGDRMKDSVVCTPEVSLYQYNAGEGPSTILDENKGPNNRHEMNSGVVGSSDQQGPLVANSNGSFQCSFCGKSFQQKNTFQNHLRSHREGEDNYQCDICGKTFAVPARLTRHYRTHTGEKPFSCEYCHKSFSVKENLSVHRRIHTKERPYKCEVCERAFEHSGKLHRHMRIHTGERPHRCQICQKTFIQSGQLVIHMRTHTGEKPYVCKVCNKGFTCSKQLKVHTRTHTGEKPYSCDICGKSFGYNHVLKLHQVAHYGEKIYKCTLCNGTYNSKKALETHIKTHNSDATPIGAPSPIHSHSHSHHHHSELTPMLSPPTSGTPMNSDKENRESSDSEISSQSSPPLDTPPKTPPSPNLPSYVNKQFQQFQGANQHNNSNNHHNSNQYNLPYPMLPPGIEVRPAPEKRTTFLYVTSKLPGQQQQQQLGHQENHHSQQQQQQQQQGRIPSQVQIVSGNSLNFRNFGQHPLTASSSGISSTKSIAGQSSSSTSSSLDPKEADRFIFQSAMIRDKVLAFTEKFGYGLPSGNNSNSNSNGSNNSNSSSSSLTENSSFHSNYRPRFENSIHQQHQSSYSSNSMSNGDSRTKNYSGHINIDSKQHQQLIFQQQQQQQQFQQQQQQINHQPKQGGREGSSNGFYPGGVLALALTRGSKAVVSNPLNGKLGFKGAADICIDYSGKRSGSVSPSSSIESIGSRSRTPEEQNLSDQSDEGGSIGGGVKRSIHEMGNGRQGGPRKKSSLILEKYAQENPGKGSPVSADSILSQRLRLSSVIQYAEKCT